MANSWTHIQPKSSGDTDTPDRDIWQSAMQCDLPAAANDNLEVSSLDTLLRHQGCGSTFELIDVADLVRARAEHAFFADDLHAYRYWLKICRSIDRRIIAGLSPHTEQIHGRG